MIHLGIIRIAVFLFYTGITFALFNMIETCLGTIDYEPDGVGLMQVRVSVGLNT